MHATSTAPVPGSGTGTTSALTFCLFDRHELPANDGALYVDYDWRNRRGVKQSGVYKSAINELMAGRDVRLYVTGLTPALTEFVSQAIALRFTWQRVCRTTGGVTLLHYDRDTGSYFEQSIF